MGDDLATSSYGIGAVIRRTGVSGPRLRMWEKRYRAVVPQRTPTNRRRYSAEDVERLALLAQLTREGHSISAVANLDLEALNELLEQVGSRPAVRSGSGPESRVLAVGVGLDQVLAGHPSVPIVLEGHFEGLGEALASGDLPQAEVAVIETETLFPDTVASVRELVARVGAQRLVLLYHFCASRTAAALARAIPGLQLLAAPIPDERLRRECLVQIDSLEASPRVAVDSETLPERLYTADQLARLTRISTTVECECPRHLAGLLQGLAAFERYSSECEDRNPDDALLHAFLHRTTARVRRTMEEALQHVMQAEGIEVK